VFLNDLDSVALRRPPLNATVRREEIAHDLVICAPMGTRLNLRSASGHHLESTGVTALLTPLFSISV
jgi:hypothetical protein